MVSLGYHVHCDQNKRTQKQFITLDPGYKVIVAMLPIVNRQWHRAFTHPWSTRAMRCVAKTLIHWLAVVYDFVPIERLWIPFWLAGNISYIIITVMTHEHGVLNEFNINFVQQVVYTNNNKKINTLHGGFPHKGQKKKYFSVPWRHQMQYISIQSIHNLIFRMGSHLPFPGFPESPDHLLPNEYLVHISQLNNR